MHKIAVRLVLWAATLAAVSASSQAVVAQQREPDDGAAAVPPEGLNGLSPEQAGAVAGSPLDGSGTAIAPSDLRLLEWRPELQVAGPAAAALAPAPPGTIDEGVLSAEVTARLEPLNDCRISVARRKQVVASDVAADRLTLRWIIARTGSALGAQVVAITPTDDGVLDCVKRQMAGWTFSQPSGGALPVERDFTFRPVSPASPVPPAPERMSP